MKYKTVQTVGWLVRLRVLGALVVYPIVLWSAQAAGPNILFFSMDDLKPELGCYGSEHVKTPNIDRLAKNGMLFERHYIQQAVCGPSRASMFSGLRPDTTRVWDLQHTCREECPKAFTMQEYFKKAGYATAGAGKIMHGFKNDDPPSWSIPYVHSEALPYADGRLPALDKYQGEQIHAAFQALEEKKIKGYKQRNQFMAGLGAMPATECIDRPDDAYPDGAMTEWALGMLDRLARADGPFYLTLGYRKPHLPFVAPKKYWDLFDRAAIDVAEFQKLPKGAPEYAGHSWGELKNYSDVDKDENLSKARQRELIHGYYACVAYVDAQIGKVLAKLKETGLDGNTVVVLWGDHGWHLGDHGIWCKHSNYEQATHSPLIISAPWLSQTGRAASPVESVDIFPTLCELAGLPVPEQLEGTSLVPILKNPKARVKDFAMSQYPRSHKKNMGYAMRTERYRMVTWVPEDVAQTGTFNPSQIDAIELYDYQTDPLETVNLANHPEYKAVVLELSKKLEGFFE
ncbi:Choline-sulfatase [Pontiella desulfatans]|uniref:Choline-sulfatase n=1 Tax=Pontiella desulfatans TaxID=2750659 RepID=A0A6C2U7B5_PONDE|nr:sulfatase [Pontiella desulfatans]SPS73961.1 sulfatase S1_7 [Kiritimatiellales bacterium]VGO15314.1 Choline-sulfatase [Pontiella desulfatans]